MVFKVNVSCLSWSFCVSPGSEDEEVVWMRSAGKQQSPQDEVSRLEAWGWSMEGAGDGEP